MPISRSTVEEVLDRANIFEIVSQFVALKKTGRNYTGLCPFHADTKPSFTVSEEKNLFYCFGCQKGGNVIHFLMEMKNLTFVEALEELARRYGVKIEYDREKLGESYKRRQATLDLNNEANEFFKRQLKAEAGERARNYIASRGISDDVSRKFQLGYAPNSWEALLKHLRAKGFGEQLAESAGLLVRSSSGKLHDRFRDRIIFPIIDAQGNAVAFSGRIIDKGEPKYLNSPESDVFKKGQMFFGLYQARSNMRELAIIVEGNFDCVVLHQHGLTETVATLGTALTNAHARLISKYTDRIALIFDGDSAGQRALERSAELFAAQPVQPLAVILPEGEDPDSFCRSRGPDALKALIDKSRPILEHMIHIQSERAQGSVEDRTAAANAALELIALVKDRLRRDLLIQLASDELGVPEDSLRYRLRSVQKSKAKEQDESGKPTQEQPCLLSPAKTIFEAFIQFPNLSEEFIETFSDWKKAFENNSDAWTKALVQVLDEGSFRVESILSEPALSSLSGEMSEMLLDKGSFTDRSKAREAIHDCALKIAEKKVKVHLANITQQLRDAQKNNDQESIANLLAQREEVNAKWRALWRKIKE